MHQNPCNFFNDEQREQELLGKEPEEEILSHIVKERNYTQQSLSLIHI